MVYKKNTKRIDPRYFLHETVNRNDDGSVLEEAEFQDTGFGEEDIEVNRAAASSGFEEMQAQMQMRNKVIEAAVEAVGDWIEDEDDNDWPEPGVDDRKTFLKKLDQYSQTYGNVSVADVLGIKLG
jgi:hypothetical protein